MNFNYSITEQIEHYSVTVNYNGLTGREIILVNGEQKYNRLNWTASKSDYLVHLDAQLHVRIQLSVSLDSTLNVSFLRGGKVLANHTIPLYSQPSDKILAEPDNAAWLAELTIPKRVSLLLPAAVLTFLLTAWFKSPMVAAVLMALLTLLCLVLMFKPATIKATRQPSFTKGLLKIGFAKGMLYGASLGGVIGYSYSIFTSTIARLLLGS